MSNRGPASKRDPQPGGVGRRTTVVLTTLAVAFYGLPTVLSSQLDVADGAVPSSLSRVSVAHTTGTQGSAESRAPSISGDGRYVAFYSLANNLVANDGNVGADIFVRDRTTQKTMKVSVTTNGSSPNGNSFSPSISQDGRFVAYHSSDQGLHPKDRNHNMDVYVRDRDMDGNGIFDETLSGAVETDLVSIAYNGSNGGNDWSGHVSMAGEARQVAFQSNASDLIPVDQNGHSSDIFVRDLVADKTTRVSVTSNDVDNTGGSGSDNRGASISADGRFVVFTSGSNLLYPNPDPHPSGRDVFIRDRDTDEDGVFDESGAVSTSLVSPDAGGLDRDAVSPAASISPDGRYVALWSNYKNPSDPGLRTYSLWVYDRIQGTRTKAAASLGTNPPSFPKPSLSSGGDSISFDTDVSLIPADTNTARDVYIYHPGSGTLSLAAARSGTDLGNGASGDAELSPDGAYIAFDSVATNLVDNDTNGVADVFLNDVAPFGVPVGQTFGISGTHAVDPSGTQGDPVDSATGSYVTEVTDAELSGIGLPFRFARSYTSADTTSGALGIGWTHPYAASLSIQENGDVSLRAENGQKVAYTQAGDGSFAPPPGGRSQLASTANGYELTRRDQVRYSFDSSGLLTEMRDRNNRTLSFAYGAGKLVSITDTAGRAVTFTHDAAGLLTDIALPGGRSVTYSYTDGKLTEVTDVRGGITTYAYDGSGRLTKVVDQNDHTVIENTYGTGGRVTEQVDARGNRTTFSWNAATQTSTMTDPRGNTWKDIYSNNILIKRIDPLGNTTEFDYDQDLNVIGVTDPRGNKTTMTYDSKGNMLTRSAPATLGYEPERWTYTPHNRVYTYEDRLGHVTDFDYDAAGNLTKVTRPGGFVTQTPRTPEGLVDKVIDPRLKTTDYNYDASGNLTEVVTPKGHKTTMGYDSSGRMTTMVEGRGNEAGATPADFTWTYGYDAANHLTRLTDPLGHESTWSYDPAGNLDFAKDAKLRTTDYDYNPANLLTKVVAPGGAETSYDYDAVGNLSSRTDANLHTTTYTYSANRLESATLPGGAKWTYAYDANGNLKTVTDAAGNATPGDPDDGKATHGYDAMNRMTSINYSDSTPDVGFGYDANNRTSMTDGQGTETYSYDNLDRVTAVTRGTTTLSYDYNATSQITKRTYPGGVVVDYAYDDDSLLDTVTSGGAVTDYGYDAAGRLETTTLPSSNGHVETRSYNRAGRLTEVENAKAGAVLSRFTYTLDDEGNPTAVTDQDGAVTSYIYHPDRDFLTEVCYQASCPAANDPFIRYDYDPVGNRTEEIRPAGTTTYAYDAADRITLSTGPSGATTYSHDANGNLTQAGGRTFAYDLANRMTSTTSGPTTTTYTYDGDGKRLKASTGAGAAETTNYLWDPSFPLPELIRETDGADSVLRRYVHGNDLVSMTTGGDTAYYHHDGLGSVTNVTNASGVAQWTYSYEPFGSIRTETRVDQGASDNHMKFTGEYLDPTELYHLRARQYDPGIGRFASIDPMPPRIMDPSVSTYLYANDRPTVWTDPSGMMPLGEGRPKTSPSELLPTPQPGGVDPNVEFPDCGPENDGEQIIMADGLVYECTNYLGVWIWLPIPPDEAPIEPNPIMPPLILEGLIPWN